MKRHIIQLKRTMGNGMEIDNYWKDHEIYFDLDEAVERYEYFMRICPTASVRIITIKAEN